MAAKLVIKDAHVVPMGFANAFLIEGDDGLTMIDAGYTTMNTLKIAGRAAPLS